MGQKKKKINTLAGYSYTEESITCKNVCVRVKLLVSCETTCNLWSPVVWMSHYAILEKKLPPLLPGLLIITRE